MESFFYRIWKRFLTFFGDIYCAFRPPKVKAVHIRKLIDMIEPGDILCRKYTWYLDSYFIKGEYSHSGVCLDSETVIHSIAEGVEEIDVIDFVKDADGFILIRPLYQSLDQQNMVIDFAVQHIGHDYDFLFDKKDKSKFYCHELSFHSLRAGGFDIRADGDYVFANDLIKFCGTVYETDLG